MTGKLMFVPDDYVVVPREPTNSALNILKAVRDGKIGNCAAYREIIAESPQLTTPSLLRREGDNFYLGDVIIGFIDLGVREEDGIRWSMLGGFRSAYAFSVPEARRAAEKALGLPIVEEV